MVEILLKADQYIQVKVQVKVSLEGLEAAFFHFGSFLLTCSLWLGLNNESSNLRSISFFLIFFIRTVNV